ncbi:hypothetical protein Tco_1362237 [Tanacetum coccineum]
MVSINDISDIQIVAHVVRVKTTLMYVVSRPAKVICDVQVAEERIMDFNVKIQRLIAWALKSILTLSEAELVNDMVEEILC